MDKKTVNDDAAAASEKAVDAVVLLFEDGADPETGNRKVVAFDLADPSFNIDIDDDDNNHPMSRTVQRQTACVVVGTVILFAMAYAILAILDTKLSAPLDAFLALMFAITALTVFCVMRHFAIRASRERVRKNKRRNQYSQIPLSGHMEFTTAVDGLQNKSPNHQMDQGNDLDADGLPITIVTISPSIIDGTLTTTTKKNKNKNKKKKTVANDPSKQA